MSRLNPEDPTAFLSIPQHGREAAGLRKITPEEIDSIVRMPEKVWTQPNGRHVFLGLARNKWWRVIRDEDGTIVTVLPGRGRNTA